MKEERLRVAQVISNEVIEAYRDQGIIEHCSEEMRHRLGRDLADKISDGNSYIVTIGKERTIPDYMENASQFVLTAYVSRFIRCINCKYTPEIAEEALPFVERLLCHRTGEIVRPHEYCAWAKERSEDSVNSYCPWRWSRGQRSHGAE